MLFHGQTIQQYAAVAADGFPQNQAVEILLITSRESGRCRTNS